MKFKFEQAPHHAFWKGKVNSADWNSWAWQLRSSLKTELQFRQIFSLTQSESLAFQGSEIFNIRTTPYYASLCTDNENDPLRKILMPTAAEFLPGSQAQLDPLNELRNNPAPRIIHRYPDRALFLVTDICSVYCRFCTRKHFTGNEQAFLQESEYELALKYIRKTVGLREVILSGGDPLTLSTLQLDRVLSDLRQIEHIEIIRIGTRMPVVCPMRVDTELVKVIKKHNPVYVMTHFNHPRELTQEAASALTLIADSGVPMMNQMVLLNGVNNHAAIVQALSRRLLYLRVKPYYMFQCDPSQGTDHLRISLEESESIQRELWGRLSGLAMPNLTVDIPSGGGKVGLTPHFEISRNSQERLYQGWDGVREKYINPDPKNSQKPTDVGLYLGEWHQLVRSKERSSDENHLLHSDL